MGIDSQFNVNYNHQVICKIWLAVLMASLVGVFLFSLTAYAQENQSDVIVNNSQQNLPNIDVNDSNLSKLVTRNQIPKEVIADYNISLEELKLEKTRILPDSPIHMFKRIGWGIHEAFTFDTVRDTELKLQHANQYLGEAKQLIDEQGIENINPKVLNSTIKRFEGKFGDVKNQARNLVSKKNNNPQAIEDLMDNLTDKQLKHRKLLDGIERDVINVKKLAKETGQDLDSNIETVLGQVEDTKNQSIGDLTQILTTVDVEPEKVRVRIEKNLEKQGGSEFKSLKNLEILEAIHDKAPNNIQIAIKKAKKNTIQRFELRLEKIPESNRGQRFKKYVEHATIDETRLVSVLEEIKQSNGIPDDLLFKIEEAKEIAVRNFENKLRLINDTSIEARYFQNFDSSNVDDLVTLEEFKNRMSTDSDEFRTMEIEHSKALGEFKAKFTDSDSKAQAERFQKLSDELLNNPTPKTFKLMASLEEEVRNDPVKAAFLDQMENAMEQQFETRYRREGDNFMDRVTTLDPNDIGFFDKFKFGDSFRNRFVEHSADRYKGFMKDENIPENFDRFHERFFNVGDFVINEIRTADVNFQDSMQFKVRKMEEIRAEKEREITSARLDIKERELLHQSDRIQRQEEDEFWNKLNDVPWDDFQSRKALWDKKINSDYTRVDEQYNEQKRIFESRIANDPWCDSVCQQIQLQYIEQDLRHKQERLADDLVRQRNKIEQEKVQFERENPLANICNTPASCEQYCRINPTVAGCEWAIHEQRAYDCPQPKYWDPEQNRCVNTDEINISVIACGEGQYRNGQNCILDPYYKVPSNFQNCGFGFHWDAQYGFCEPDFDCSAEDLLPPRDCKPGEVPKTPSQNDFCGQPSCILRHTTICPDLTVLSPLPCENGYVREVIKNSQGCAGFGSCVPSGSGEFCPDIYEPVCGSDEATYSNDCYAKQANVTIKYFGECGNIFQDCGVDQYWANKIKSCLDNHDYVPFKPGSCDKGWVWEKKGFCKQDKTITDSCSYVCDPKCTGSSYCLYDNLGCATECSPSCAPGDYYDQLLGVCLKIESKNPEPGENNWLKHTWTFGDGQIETSYILNRTDSEYTQYIASIESKCKSITKSQFEWMSNAGDDSKSNWTQFGIPNCSGISVSTECGNGICEEYESSETCFSDCGGTVADCPATMFNNYTSGANCNYSACPNGCDYAEGSCPVGCYSDTNVCTTESYWDEEAGTCVPYEERSYCGDNVCGDTESIDTCATDCGGSGVTCPANVYNDYTNSYSCSYSECASGCQFDSDGCATGCWKAPKCESNQFNNFSDTSICSSKACVNGCNYNSLGCPVGCLSSGGVCPSNIYNNKSSSYSCSYSQCPSGCTYDPNSCPKGCATDTCGDGICGSSESSNNCASDCTVTGNYCGDGVCDSSESSVSCSSDCGATDYCGDGICNSTESTSTCASDCGASSTVCTDSAFTGEYGACDYATCSNGCTFGSDGCPNGCNNAGECGNNVCDVDETSESCPIDCGGYNGDSCNYNSICESNEDNTCSDCTTGCGGNTNESSCTGQTNCCWYNYEGGNYCYYDSVGCTDYTSTENCNYDGICDSNESIEACSADCSSNSTSSTYCGDGTCDANEDSSWCFSDCTEASSGSGIVCPSTEFNDFTTGNSCSSSNCPNGCTWDSNSCPTGCDNPQWCGDGTCQSYEDSTTCSIDCGAVEGASTKRLLNSQYNPFNVFRPVTKLLGF